MATFIASALWAIGTSAATSAAIFVLGNAALINGALLLGASLVMSAAQKRKAKRQAREQYNASQVDRLATVDSAVQPRHLVLGRVRKSGQIFMRGTLGTNNSVFIMAIELAFHEIDGVEKVYFNDVEVEVDADGLVLSAPYSTIRTESATPVTTTGTATVLNRPPIAGSVTVVRTTASGQVSVPFTVVGSTVTIAAADVGAVINYQYLWVHSYVRVRTIHGSSEQQADAQLMSAFPSMWTAQHRARGVAYLVCEFNYNETLFPSGLPNVTALVRGAKVYDPRTGTVAWSENPALLMRHVYTHAYFGNKQPTADIDMRIAAAANVCDASANYVVDGVTTTRPLYTAGLVVNFGGAARDALDDLAQAMAGAWAYGRGELFVKAGAYTAPVMTLTEADLAVEVRGTTGAETDQQPISISVHRARNDKFNVANVRIWDGGQNFKEAALTPLKAQGLILRDLGELPREISMPAVSYAPQALHIAGIAMRDERDALTVVIACKLRAYPLELFDTVRLTLARYGWTDKEFMVVGREWALGGLIQLTLKETAAAIYTMDAEFEPQGYGDNTALPAPWDIQPPSTLTITSGTGELIVQAGAVRTRARVSWAPISDPSITDGGMVEVQYRNASTPDWRSITVLGAEVEAILTEVQDGEILLVRARTRSRLAVSDWGLQQMHEVVGQTERPAAPAGFSVAASAGFALASWQLHPAPDVRYGGQIVIRHSPETTGAVWESGYVLEVFDGNSTTGSVPLITGTYMAKARDAAGNWTETAASFVAREGMVTGFVTVATVTEHPAFAGAKTNTGVVDDTLRLTSATTIGGMLTPISAWGHLGALGGIAATGEYEFASVMDLTTIAVRRLEADMQVHAYDADDIISSRTNVVSSWSSVGGQIINDCDVTLLASTTDDDPSGTPTWGAWTPFMVADFNCRALRFKALLESGQPTHNIRIEQLSVAAKVPA